MQMRKIELSNRKKKISNYDKNYDKKILLRIQFILEIYLYRQK